MHVPQPLGRYRIIGGLIGRREMGHEGVKYGRLNTVHLSMFLLLPAVIGVDKLKLT